MASKITNSSEQATLLFAAIEHGNLVCVKSLLKSGASPNARSEYGIMPLMLAAKNDHPGIFFALVEAGADLHATRFGDLDSVLNYAVQGNTDSRLKMVQAILSDRKFHLADGFDGPFAMACKNGSPAIVRALLAAGANVNGEYWPLLEATRWNMLDNVR